MKFEKRIYCGNCEQGRTYRFEQGTELRGKQIKCANCGVLIPACAADRRTPKLAVTESPREPWAFLRDFFGVAGRSGR